ncbi:NPP1 family protein [Marinomonas transparens]|nr:NPP1 family protein [Marinomonas transparens]
MKTTSSTTIRRCIITTFAIALSTASLASDFVSLQQALPTQVDALSIAPVFDFDSDSCLPAAGISQTGDRNGGQKPTGSLTGACRSPNFLEQSNTLHRYACKHANGINYCGHFYALYFEKDQLLAGIESGHRHDWEYVAVWTEDGTVTHGSYSAHGDLTTQPAAELSFEEGHLQIVYHKEGVGSHALRFAKTAEQAENPYGRFVTPTIISWYEFAGEGWNNLVMRTLLDGYDYGSANLPTRESSFLGNLNEFKPATYPDFSAADVLTSNTGVNESFTQYVNRSSGLCMDITDIKMQNGTNVMQWDCNGGKWQRWYLEASSGLIHSQQDPRFCLDNSSVYGNGANIMIWQCHGGDSQRFVTNNDGSIGIEVDSNQVIDGAGPSPSDNIATWWNWGGANQYWNLIP